MFRGYSTTTVAKSDLKERIEEELAKNETKKGWKGAPVEIRRNTFGLNKALRGEVQNEGLAHGCHTCLTHVEVDADQPWIGDHIPPTELDAAVRKKYDLPKVGTFAKLFPQCHECSSEQSGLVKRLNSMGPKALANFDIDDNECLLGGGDKKTTKYCIDSTGPKVSTAEGQDIQRLGKANGCHSCGAKYPCKVYHSDHTFPQEWCTTYMEEVFKKLGLTYPRKFYLKPQCPRCSGDQGGNVSSIMWDALNFAGNNGITVMKDIHFSGTDYSK